MADADMGVTETSATGVDLVAAMVQKQLIAKAKLMFTVMDESSRATKGAKSVSFPRTGDLTPVAKTENTASESIALTYAADQLALDQHYQAYVRLEDIADAQSVLNVESDILERASAGMAKVMDTKIYTVLKAGASASAPDHIIDHYGSSGAITRTKILQARKLLDDQNVPDEDRFLVVNPAQEAELLDIDGFVDADKYGSTAAKLNGEIGRLFGFTVIKTTVCEDNVSLYYHRSACAFARQIEPKWEQGRDLSRLANEYSLSALYGAKVLDSGKRNVTANATGS
jgi:N4-gp56 family major capsid protein